MTPELINGLFAILGAVVGAGSAAILSWLQQKKSEKRQELTVISSQPTRLVAVHSAISKVVEVFVHGKKVPTVFTVDITVANSGTQSITEIKVPLKFRPPTVVAADIASSSHGFPVETSKVVVSDPETVVVEVDYLNPGEQLVARVIFSDQPKGWDLLFRKPDVRCNGRMLPGPGIPGIYATNFYESIRRNRLLHMLMLIAEPRYRRYLSIERQSSGDGREKDGGILTDISEAAANQAGRADD